MISLRPTASLGLPHLLARQEIVPPANGRVAFLGDLPLRGRTMEEAWTVCEHLIGRTSVLKKPPYADKAHHKLGLRSTNKPKMNQEQKRSRQRSEKHTLNRPHTCLFARKYINIGKKHAHSHTLTRPSTHAHAYATRNSSVDSSRWRGAMGSPTGWCWTARW